MKIDVMTSFSKEYYDKLGKYSVKTFLKYWPEDINMLAYVEGCRLEDHPRIKQIPLTSLDKEYHDFQDNSKYKSRTKTFAKKGYSWVDAVMTSDADYLIWLDADLMTTQPVSKQFIESFCDSNLLSSFMGVYFSDKFDKKTGKLRVFDKPKLGAETGIYFYNLKHPQAKNFASRYKEYYTQGLDKDLRRFIDTDVFGACVVEYTQKGVKFDNFNPGNYKTPLSKTKLHPTLQHLKAGLKRSDDTEGVLYSMLGDTYHEPTLELITVDDGTQAVWKQHAK